MIRDPGYYLRATWKPKGSWERTYYWTDSFDGWMDERGHATIWPLTAKGKAKASKVARALRLLAEAEGDKFTITIMVRR